MAEDKVSKGKAKRGQTLVEGPPRSLKISGGGIRTASDFANLMSALMSDLIEGRITPSIGNATCNAGGKLLKVVEMSYKYGTRGKGQQKTLLLAFEEEPQPESKAQS